MIEMQYVYSFLSNILMLKLAKNYSKKDNSVYIKMKINKVVESKFDLISVSDDKLIIVDLLEKIEGVIKENSAMLEELNFASLRPEERIVGVEIFEHTNTVLVCSDFRKCVFKDPKNPLKPEKVLYTGETISGIFLMQNTYFFGVIDSYQNTISFYNYVSLDNDMKINSTRVAEFSPFNNE